MKTVFSASMARQLYYLGCFIDDRTTLQFITQWDMSVHCYY